MDTQKRNFIFTFHDISMADKVTHGFVAIKLNNRVFIVKPMPLAALSGCI
jgi:hypothetical protein